MLGGCTSLFDGCWVIFSAIKKLREPWSFLPTQQTCSEAEVFLCFSIASNEPGTSAGKNPPPQFSRKAVDSSEHITSWKPNDWCFEWKRTFFWRVEAPKIEDKPGSRFRKISESLKASEFYIRKLCGACEICSFFSSFLVDTWFLKTTISRAK